MDIAIRRPGVDDLIPLTVERDEIRIPTVRTAFMIAPGTGYVRLQDFSETTNDRARRGARPSSRRAGMQRLVLDLRDNPGGPLDQAIAVSSRFLKRGQMVVYTRGRIPEFGRGLPRCRAGRLHRRCRSSSSSTGSSASASEIVTGAMQDHDRGLVVGETTFGKALVQSVYPISNGAGLALTTGRYYTPSGRMIQRPWDGSFDEYLTYSLARSGGRRATHAPSELKYTDGKRKVYGGGGIEPDHFVAGSGRGLQSDAVLAAAR